MRHAVEDVLIANQKFFDLPQQSVIATSSIRRVKQLKLLRNDIEFEAIRGNVATRLEKYLNKDVDGIILARAGIERLNLDNYIKEIFSATNLIPAAGQGALAVECKNNSPFAQYVAKINDDQSYNALIAERACMQGLGGHCFAPIGVYSYFQNNVQFIEAAVIGEAKLFVKLSGLEPKQLGLQAADMLNKQGAQQLIKVLQA